MSTDSSNSNDSPFIGCFFLLVIALIAGIWIYNAFKTKEQPIAVSLAAYFIDGAGSTVVSEERVPSHLKIKGTATQAGKLVDAGNVRLTVTKTDNSFQQTIATEVKAGQFESDDVAFHPLSNTDKIHIKAEVGSSTVSAPTTAELYVNASPPALTQNASYLLWGGVLGSSFIILIVFFITFTGQRTPKKNRTAIIFSYLFGGVFLAVPILAPILLLRLFPDIQRAMIGMPAGLVLTKVGTDNKYQWAVNIGGYSKLATQTKPDATAGSSPSPSPSPSPTSTRATAGAIASPSPNATSSPSSSPQPTQTSATASAGSPTPLASPSAGASTSTTKSKQPEAKADEWDGIVDVEGGLVIPLYVVILSVIGGAINMTRKVPRFQGEGEYSEPPSLPSFRLGAFIKGAGARVAGWFGGASRRAARAAQLQAVQEAQRSIEESVASEPKVAPVVADANAAQPPAVQPAATVADPATAKKQADEEDERNLNDDAKTIDAELDGLVKDQMHRDSDSRRIIKQIRQRVQDMQKIFEQKPDDERLMGFDSFEAWLGSRVSLKEVLGTNWRVELLNQYMYLISAPFLAIVAYYMLDLLSLTKQPILVLISFSVGLISERILSWLLGLASGYLRTNPNQSGAKP